MLYLGIDVGTSGIRGVLIDDDDAVVACEQRPLPTPKGSRQSPLIWETCLQQLLQALLGSSKSSPVALAIDGTSGTVVACDAQGEPLAEAIMYNDTASQQAAVLIERFAPADSIARGPASALARCLRLQQEIGQPVAHFLNQADWLAGRLLQRFDCSDENNALKMGYDPQARCWPQWIFKTGLHQEQLPKVQAPASAYGRVAAKDFAGLNTNSQVIAGTTDSVAAFIATGAHQAATAVTSLGSTLALKIISPQPISAPQFGVYSHRLGDLWLAGGASNSGGAVLRQFFSDVQLRELSEKIDPQTNTQLHYYPLPATGERFPLNDPQLQPKLDPRPTNDVTFLQGLLEGIADIEKQGYACLQKLGAPYPREVLSAGGGAHNPVWTRIRQTRLNVPVKTATHSDAAYGAALLAKWGAKKENPYVHIQ